MLQELPFHVKRLLGLYRWEEVARCPQCASGSLQSYGRYRSAGIGIRLRRCDGCGLVLQSPRLTAPSLARFYRTDYARHQGGARPTDRERQFERGIRRGRYVIEFLQAHGVNPGGQRVTEIGCSYGGVLEAFRRSGCAVSGFDLSSAAVAYARTRGLDVTVGSVEEWPAPPAAANVLLLSHLLEHVAEPKRVLERARQALAPGGVLYVEVPGLQNPRTGPARAVQVAHLLYFTLETVRQLVEACGFRYLGGTEAVQSVFSRE